MTTEERPYQDERPRPQRGRRVLVVLLVLLLLLVGLLVVADRVAAGVAERALTEQVREELATQGVQAGPPEVEIGGFPFVTQVLDGRYERISIGLKEVRGSVQGDVLALPTLDIDAYDVTASLDTLRSGRGGVIAGSVTGTGTISYDSLATRLDREGLQLGERDGRLAVTAPVDILGQQVPVSGTADITVEQGQVALRFTGLTAEGLPNGSLARMLLSNFAEGISVDVPLPALPFDLTVSEVRPLPEGLQITAEAVEVPINAAS
ncbi:DUF2993 domain-containing protein [Salinispora tropica]|uniref:DUF2993 domain-containing protein n=1 Tax=Salinispora tropica (strain ATCC BAA-916 / DSM 44818 / JCM 13857 / NBRC 105044 / CNB-440) TaxID=369723 RepID=A4X1N0_SALTO|nr:DUF2993 domain-containing protein [Salinispora tropica]ABP52780.1 hypothetical protein Strop_0295 [Salinispora tropica CNB-440]